MTTNLEEKRKWRKKRMKKEAQENGEYPNQRQIDKARALLMCILLSIILIIVAYIVNY
jgi:lipopolysaccharide/colanic/teichoic acid biosynthesis glycosyltransferase